MNKNIRNLLGALAAASMLFATGTASADRGGHRDDDRGRSEWREREHRDWRDNRRHEWRKHDRHHWDGRRGPVIIKERVVIRERPVYRDYPVPVREYRHFDDRSVRYSRDPAVVIGVSIPPLIFPLR